MKVIFKEPFPVQNGEPTKFGLQAAHTGKATETKLTYALHQLQVLGSRLVILGGAACLHVRAQRCNYWFFCREGKALMLAQGDCSGFACFACLLQNRVIKRRLAHHSGLLWISPFLSLLSALKLHCHWEQWVLSACPEMSAPFRDTLGSLQYLGADCFLVHNVLHLHQKWEC